MEDMQASQRVLIRIEVERLLGRFDHTLEFDQTWEFLIVHGPNGVGKTKLLELLHYTFARRFHDLARLPFKSARFEFSDLSWLKVSRANGRTDEPLFDDHTTPSHLPRNCEHLNWQASIKGRTPVLYTFDLELDMHEINRLTRLAVELPLDRLDTTRWLDSTTGEELDAYDLAERLDIQISSRSDSHDLPTDIAELLDIQQVHLIQTQRLLSTTRPHRRRDLLYRLPLQDPTVVSYASDLSSKLKAALADNSRTSQELDRSFPSRLFEQPVSHREAEAEMRRHYASQLELRERLAAIDILDRSAELQLPDRELDEWELKALNTYLDDADQKLKTFLPLLARLELMQKIVNERFLFNTLEIDQEHGFLFRDDSSQEPISPRHLSSGEQHQLVLMYDLLMKVDEFSLVLIDEPEISLHVAWQKAMLEDVRSISELRHLRFIIATHSPQIIGEWWDRTARLFHSH